MPSGPYHPGLAREIRAAAERAASGEEDPLAGADGQEKLEAARDVCLQLVKAIKQLGIFQHNRARFPEYMERCHRAFTGWIERWGPLPIKVETRNFTMFKQPLLAEDVEVAYRFYKDGIRHLIFREGLTVEELVDLALIALTSFDHPEHRGNDVLQELWRSEFAHIEYVVMEGFLIDDMTEEEVEVEADRILSYLYDRLKARTDDYLRFARITPQDLETRLDGVDSVRGVVITGAPATPQLRTRLQEELRQDRDERLLGKLSSAVFQVLEESGVENREATEEIFVRLLDAMLLQEDFTALASILVRFRALERDPRRAEEFRELHRFFVAQMGAPERIERVGLILESSRPRSLPDVTRCLTALDRSAIPALLTALDGITAAEHRQLVVDALAVLGRDDPEPFLARLETERSQTVRDMLGVLEKLDLPSKYTVYGRVMRNANLAVRLEALAVIGRSRSEQCRRLVLEALQDEQPQLRMQAAWLLPRYDPARAFRDLMEALHTADFEKRGIDEKIAFHQALGSTHLPEALAFFRELLAERSLLHRARVREHKLLAAAGLSASPSIATFKLLQAESDRGDLDPDVKVALRRSMNHVRKHLFGEG